MNIYEYINREYNYLWGNRHSNDIQNIVDEVRKHVKFVFLDKDQKYTAGCMIPYYMNEYQYCTRLKVPVLLFNQLIDVTKPLPDNFDWDRVTEDHPCSSISKFNEDVINNCNNIIQKHSEKYLSPSITFDCTFTNLITPAMYKIDNNSKINITI